MSTTSRSKKSSNNATKTASKARSKSIERPFDEDILKRAREIAAGYSIVIEAGGSGFLGRSFEMPGVLADGASPEECAKAMSRALELTVATMLELGERPPSAHWRKERTVQINVRLTPEEKFVLEDAGRQRGFKGVSDFVRISSLQEAQRS